MTATPCVGPPMWGNPYRQPSVLSSVLFFLLFSGPPKFRLRDADASLRGEIDGVVILHVIVWVVAGLWVFYQLRFYFQENLKPAGFRLPQKLGLGLVAALGLSTLVSSSPILTAFKVYQMLVSILFAMVFVERYGVEACLRKLFQASTILCVAIAVAAVALPYLVIATTETGALRLRGDFIAPTEEVALFSLVLLLAGLARLSKLAYGILLGLSCTLLVTSLSRTAYLALFVIFLLVLLKRPSSKPFRRFAYVFGVAVVPLFVLGLAAKLNQYRNPESIWNLSDRIGLWTYLSTVTLQNSPWLGLGYYSGGRVYSLQYNDLLGGPHSMFFETFVGGGLPAIMILVILCVVMSTYVIRVLRQNTGPSFVITVLYLATIMIGSIGPTLDSGPVAITFWSLAASLPILPNGSLAGARVATTPLKQLVEAR